MKKRCSTVPIMHGLFFFCALGFSTSCGSLQGCQGCEPQTIPSGFPQNQWMMNAAELRFSQTGVSFLEKNLETLAQKFLPTGLSFTIPPTENENNKICFSGDPCTVSLDLTGVKLTPSAPNLLKVLLRSQISTSKIKYEMKIPWDPLPTLWVACDVSFNSARSGKPDVGFQADVLLEVPDRAEKKLQISRSALELLDFDSADISISGGIQCLLADWLKGLFKDQIKSGLLGVVDGTLDKILTDLPLGQEGRLDLALFLNSFSPRSNGALDYLLWAGGYAQSEELGLSIGGIAGFNAPKPHPCVPLAPLPAAPVISRSAAFHGNTRPDGKPFDVGLGIHQSALNVAAFALQQSGGLCLDASTRTFAALNSSVFGLLMPSLKSLTKGQNVPVMVTTRPQQPPVVSLGKGSYKKTEKGYVIEDPLIKVKAPDFAVDLYVMLDERFVRLFRVLCDLELPFLLFFDEKGRLHPLLGDLDNALSKIRIQNLSLITEKPEDLAKLLPTIVSLAGSLLAKGFAPFEIPTLQGVQLLFDEGSLNSVDGNARLGLYGNLALGAPLMFTQPRATVDGIATIAELRVPARESFALGKTFDAKRGPSLTLSLEAALPEKLRGRRVEYAYRVNGGFYHPWFNAARITIRDPQFWIQGQHTVEVLARVEGEFASLDPTPAKLSFWIDTEAPQLELRQTSQGIRALVQDNSAPAKELNLRWYVDGAEMKGWENKREIPAQSGAEVMAIAIDPAGNQGQAQITAQGTDLKEESAGCEMAQAKIPLAFLGMVLLLLFGSLSLKRRS